jgi:hypothetical protein
MSRRVAVVALFRAAEVEMTEGREATLLRGVGTATELASEVIEAAIETSSECRRCFVRRGRRAGRSFQVSTEHRAALFLSGVQRNEKKISDESTNKREKQETKYKLVTRESNRGRRDTSFERAKMTKCSIRCYCSLP